ncbi:MAG: hypothetical protein AB2813_03175 [Candidatus Sedimenticola endophacoides]
MTSPEVLSSVIGQLRLMLPEEVFSRIEALIRDGKALPQPAELAALLEKVIQQLETKAGGKAVAEAVAGPSPALEAGEAGAAGPTPIDLLRLVKQHLEHSAETDGEPADGLQQGMDAVSQALEADTAPAIPAPALRQGTEDLSGGVPITAWGDAPRQESQPLPDTGIQIRQPMGQLSESGVRVDDARISGIEPHARQSEVARLAQGSARGGEREPPPGGDQGDAPFRQPPLGFAVRELMQAQGRSRVEGFPGLPGELPALANSQAGALGIGAYMVAHQGTEGAFGESPWLPRYCTPRWVIRPGATDWASGSTG